MGAERVVAGALGRAAVAGEVDGHHPVLEGEAVDHGLPAAPVAADAVNQQQRRALAVIDMGQLPTVEPN